MTEKMPQLRGACKNTSSFSNSSSSSNNNNSNSSRYLAGKAACASLATVTGRPAASPTDATAAACATPSTEAPAAVVATSRSGSSSNENCSLRHSSWVLSSLPVTVSPSLSAAPRAEKECRGVAAVVLPAPTAVAPASAAECSLQTDSDSGAAVGGASSSFTAGGVALPAASAVGFALPLSLPCATVDKPTSGSATSSTVATAVPVTATQTGATAAADSSSIVSSPSGDKPFAFAFRLPAGELCALPLQFSTLPVQTPASPVKEADTAASAKPSTPVHSTPPVVVDPSRLSPFFRPFFTPHVGIYVRLDAAVCDDEWLWMDHLGYEAQRAVDVVLRHKLAGLVVREGANPNRFFGISADSDTANAKAAQRRSRKRRHRTDAVKLMRRDDTASGRRGSRTEQTECGNPLGSMEACMAAPLCGEDSPGAWVSVAFQIPSSLEGEFFGRHGKAPSVDAEKSAAGQSLRGRSSLPSANAAPPSSATASTVRSAVSNSGSLSLLENGVATAVPSSTATPLPNPLVLPVLPATPVNRDGSTVSSYSTAVASSGRKESTLSISPIRTNTQGHGAADHSHQSGLIDLQLSASTLTELRAPSHDATAIAAAATVVSTNNDDTSSAHSISRVEMFGGRLAQHHLPFVAPLDHSLSHYGSAAGGSMTTNLNRLLQMQLRQPQANGNDSPSRREAGTASERAVDARGATAAGVGSDAGESLFPRLRRSSSSATVARLHPSSTAPRRSSSAAVRSPSGVGVATGSGKGSLPGGVHAEGVNKDRDGTLVVLRLPRACCTALLLWELQEAGVLPGVMDALAHPTPSSVALVLSLTSAPALPPCPFCDCGAGAQGCSGSAPHTSECLSCAHLQALRGIAKLLLSAASEPSPRNPIRSSLSLSCADDGSRVLGQYVAQAAIALASGQVESAVGATYAALLRCPLQSGTSPGAVVANRQLAYLAFVARTVAFYQRWKRHAQQRAVAAAAAAGSQPSSRSLPSSPKHAGGRRGQSSNNHVEVLPLHILVASTVFDCSHDVRKRRHTAAVQALSFPYYTPRLVAPVANVEPASDATRVADDVAASDITSPANSDGSSQPTRTFHSRRLASPSSASLAIPGVLCAARTENGSAADTRENSWNPTREELLYGGRALSYTHTRTVSSGGVVALSSPSTPGLAGDEHDAEGGSQQQQHPSHSRRAGTGTMLVKVPTVTDVNTCGSNSTLRTPLVGVALHPPSPSWQRQQQQRVRSLDVFSGEADEEGDAGTVDCAAPTSAMPEPPSPKDPHVAAVGVARTPTAPSPSSPSSSVEVEAANACTAAAYAAMNASTEKFRTLLRLSALHNCFVFGAAAQDYSSRLLRLQVTHAVRRSGEVFREPAGLVVPLLLSDFRGPAPASTTSGGAPPRVSGMLSGYSSLETTAPQNPLPEACCECGRPFPSGVALAVECRCAHPDSLGGDAGDGHGGSDAVCEALYCSRRCERVAWCEHHFAECVAASDTHAHDSASDRRLNEFRLEVRQAVRKFSRAQADLLGVAKQHSQSLSTSPSLSPGLDKSRLPSPAAGGRGGASQCSSETPSSPTVSSKNGEEGLWASGSARNSFNVLNALRQHVSISKAAHRERQWRDVLPQSQLLLTVLALKLVRRIVLRCVAVACAGTTSHAVSSGDDSDASARANLASARAAIVVALNNNGIVPWAPRGRLATHQQLLIAEEVLQHQGIPYFADTNLGCPTTVWEATRRLPAFLQVYPVDRYTEAAAGAAATHPRPHPSTQREENATARSPATPSPTSSSPFSPGTPAVSDAATDVRVLLTTLASAVTDFMQELHASAQRHLCDVDVDDGNANPSSSRPAWQVGHLLCFLGSTRFTDQLWDFCTTSFAIMRCHTATCGVRPGEGRSRDSSAMPNEESWQQSQLQQRQSSQRTLPSPNLSALSSHSTSPSPAVDVEPDVADTSEGAPLMVMSPLLCMTADLRRFVPENLYATRFFPEHMERYTAAMAAASASQQQQQRAANGDVVSGRSRSPHERSASFWSVNSAMTLSTVSNALEATASAITVEEADGNANGTSTIFGPTNRSLLSALTFGGGNVNLKLEKGCDGRADYAVVARAASDLVAGDVVYNSVAVTDIWGAP